jgi:hypothetical protein
VGPNTISALSHFAHFKNNSQEINGGGGSRSLVTESKNSVCKKEREPNCHYGNQYGSKDKIGQALLAHSICS